jgi:hypothetical protein
MLYSETVEPGTFSLLIKLMEIPILKSFSLVGGTALSLRYGHRRSVDLDLFSHERFDHSLIINELHKCFGSGFDYESGYHTFGIFCYINQVKVDLVSYPHKPIAPNEIVNNIRMYSNADIAAMKIQAILGRGVKKDFWDLFELLQHYPLQQLIDWHKQKYPNQMLAISIPNAITYFVDADESETPVGFKGQTWEDVKRTISQHVSEFLS